MSVHISSLRLAGPLALIMAEVTTLVDYQVWSTGVFAAAALSVAHWAVLHQLQDGLLINNVLQSLSVMGQERELRNYNDIGSYIYTQGYKEFNLPHCKQSGCNNALNLCTRSQVCLHISGTWSKLFVHLLLGGCSACLRCILNACELMLLWSVKMIFLVGILKP